MWLRSAVGRASHRYRGGHGFESRWSPDFFQASSFQLLKLENLLRWSLFTYRCSFCSWIVNESGLKAITILKTRAACNRRNELDMAWQVLLSWGNIVTSWKEIYLFSVSRVLLGLNFFRVFRAILVFLILEHEWTPFVTVFLFLESCAWSRSWTCCSHLLMAKWT